MTGIPTTIRTGPATVISAGEVTSFGGAPLVWGLEVDGEPVAFELGFDQDPDVVDVTVRTVEIPHGFRLICVNFDKADGRGSALPVILRDVGDDVIFVHFRVFLYGRTPDRTVHYTFYRAPRAFLDELFGGGGAAE